VALAQAITSSTTVLRSPGVVEEMVMIARMWRGWVRTEQANAYVAYITGTGA
jgi:hypothetical protein